MHIFRVILKEGIWKAVVKILTIVRCESLWKQEKRLRISDTHRPYNTEIFSTGSSLYRSTPVSHSSVLDSDRDKLVSKEKTKAALKSHSEAERRRRERINTNLDTIHGLMPHTRKMEKAALLAEVITQVKEMKKAALESSQGLIIPTDNEEIKVEPLEQINGTFLVKASLCCEYKPELLSEVRRTLDSLHLSIVKAEISTLGNWVNSEFVLVSKKDVFRGDSEVCQVIVESVHRALSRILEKMAVSAEYTPRRVMQYKQTE